MGFLTVVFYIVLTIYLLGLLGRLAFRYLIYRAKKDMERGGTGSFYRTYTWGGAPRQPSAEQPKEGEVKIKTTDTAETKRIRKDVGDYVDYEEINKTE